MKVGGFVAVFALSLTVLSCTASKQRRVIPITQEQMALRIVCAPDEAQVRIDGVPQGSCRWLSKPRKVVLLKAGSHELEVRAAGYTPFMSQFSAEGMQQSLTINLVRSADVKGP